MNFATQPRKLSTPYREGFYFLFAFRLTAAGQLLLFSPSFEAHKIAGLPKLQRASISNRRFAERTQMLVAISFLAPWAARPSPFPSVPQCGNVRMYVFFCCCFEEFYLRQTVALCALLSYICSARPPIRMALRLGCMSGGVVAVVWLWRSSRNNTNRTILKPIINEF